MFVRDEEDNKSGSCNECIDLLSDLLWGNNSRPLLSLEAVASNTAGGPLSMVE